MKNITTILFNIGYWVIYLIVVNLFYNAVTTQEVVISLLSKIHWKLSFVIIVPSVLAFYLGFTYIFNQVESKLKKRTYLINAAIITSLIIGIMWVPLVNFVWQSPRLSVLSDFFYYIQMGLPLSLLWFVQITSGLFLRVFLKWFNNL